jgi:hypothetical protein
MAQDFCEGKAIVWFLLEELLRRGRESRRASIFIGQPGMIGAKRIGRRVKIRVYVLRAPGQPLLG